MSYYLRTAPREICSFRTNGLFIGFSDENVGFTDELPLARRLQNNHVSRYKTNDFVVGFSDECFRAYGCVTVNTTAPKQTVYAILPTVRLLGFKFEHLGLRIYSREYTRSKMNK